MWRDNSFQARVTCTHWSTKWNAINGRRTIQLFLALPNVVTSTVVAGMVANWENYTSQRQNQTMYSSRSELISVTCTVMGKKCNFGATTAVMRFHRRVQVWHSSFAQRNRTYISLYFRAKYRANWTISRKHVSTQFTENLGHQSTNL